MKRPTPKQNLRAVAFLVVVDLALGSFFWACNYGYSVTRGPALVILRPTPIIWYAESLFLAVLLGIAFFDSTAVRKPTPRQRRICVLLMCIFAIIPLMQIRKHARFTSSSLIDQPMFALREDSHPYRDISDIMLAYYWISTRSQRGPSSERGVFISFSDGTQWSPRASQLRAGEPLSAEVARLISARTGVPVRYADRDVVIGRPR